MFPPDPLARRVAGVFLLMVAFGIMAAFTWAIGSGPVPFPGAAVVVAVAGGFGAAGLSLVLSPLGRRRR